MEHAHDGVDYAPYPVEETNKEYEIIFEDTYTDDRLNYYKEFWKEADNYKIFIESYEKKVSMYKKWEKRKARLSDLPELSDIFGRIVFYGNNIFIGCTIEF